MTRELLILTSVLLLGACSSSCSDKFEDLNAHLLESAQSVYSERSLGALSADKAFMYQEEIEEAYALFSDGSALCESNEERAEDKFESAEELLDGLDSTLDNIEESKGE